MLPLGHMLAATTIRRHVATLGRRLENPNAEAIAVEQRRHTDPAGRFDIPRYSSVRACRHRRRLYTARWTQLRVRSYTLTRSRSLEEFIGFIENNRTTRALS